ncbi:hypothetical protein MPLA_1670044 [Mesorhizobium sp. ORS 3359]|nr:hypothetical protein MPLA_1670044 [Mesorhizobium sp. ORS 3359]
MVGPEGRRFLREINTLAAGSPAHFLRILSYGLANPSFTGTANLNPIGVGPHLPRKRH